MSVELVIPGRVALVTGGSAGLGRAIADRFAAAGARVAIAARNADKVEAAAAAIAAEHGAEVIGISADVSQAAPCEALVSGVEERLGPVDILVNNAGSSARSPFVEVTDEAWQADFDLKVFAAIRLMRRVFPGMCERRFGRIINVLNTGAKAPPATGAPTAVSRAAGMALTKVLAGEGAPHNVLVNGLMVGKIRSEQWERRFDAGTGDDSLEDYYARMGAELPMGRYGTAEEFANVACFLASDAGSYVNGVAINVDGGLCPVV